MSGFSAGVPALWRHAEVRRGAREMAGVAVANSFGIFWSVVMSLLVFSGTGQLASLPPITSGASVGARLSSIDSLSATLP